MSTNDDNTISTPVKETSQTEVFKEDTPFEELLHEMASEALSSIGKVLHEKYSEERLDGKPRNKN